MICSLRLAAPVWRTTFGNDGDASRQCGPLPSAIGRGWLCDGGTGGRAGRCIPVSRLGLMPEMRAEHASYIASWLKFLKDDRRAVFAAASHAQRAADYLNALTENEQVRTCRQPSLSGPKIAPSLTGAPRIPIGTRNESHAGRASPYGRQRQSSIRAACRMGCCMVRTSANAIPRSRRSADE